MKKFNKEKYLEKIIGLDNQHYKHVYNLLLNSLEKKYKLFQKQKFSKIWFETILDQFSIVLDEETKDFEKKLEKVLDLIVDIEIKSLEIDKDPENIFKKDSHEKHGIK